MSEPAKHDATAAAQGGKSWRARLAAPFASLMNWALASRIRIIITSAVGMVLLGSLFAAWSYFGQIALEPVDPLTVELAIAALDEGRHDDAKMLVGQMQRQPATPELLGGALFVL